MQALRAMIVWGGWDGHEPEKVAAVFEREIKALGGDVEVYNALDAFVDNDLSQYDLIVPVWTMGELSQEQEGAVTQAVAQGVGIAGCHGGMCDAFRRSTGWQFMTGGNWVSHPGGADVEYWVNIKRGSHPIVEGLQDFKVTSEQYYLHVDPAVKVLATTRFPTVDGPHSPNGPVDMPVVWIKRWGNGRVFYCSLGHKADIVEMPETLELMRRGFVWAAEGKAQSTDGAVFDTEGWY